MAPTIQSLKLQENNGISSTRDAGEMLRGALTGYGGEGSQDNQPIEADSFKAEIRTLSKQYNISEEELIKVVDKGLSKITKNKKFSIAESAEDKKARVLKFVKAQLNEYSKNNSVSSIKANDFEKFLQDKHKQKRLEAAHDGLAAFLFRYGYLNKEKLPEGTDIKTISLGNISEGELKSAVEKFVAEAIKGIKENSGDKAKIKEQMEIFRVLLSGTNDKDISKFWNAVKEVAAENGMIKQGLTDIVKNIGSTETMKNFIVQVSSEDLEKLGINKDELATAMRNVGEDPEAIGKLLDVFVNLAEDGAKVEKALKAFREANDIPDGQELTSEQIDECFKDNPELREIYEALQRAKGNLKAAHAGAVVGAVENNVDTSNHFAALKEIEKEYDVNITADLYNDVKEYAENHKDDLKISLEAFEQDFEKNKTRAEEIVNGKNNFEVKERDPDTTDSGTGTTRMPNEIALKQANIEEFLDKNSTEEEIICTIDNEPIKDTVDGENVSPDSVKNKLANNKYGLLSPSEIMYAVSHKLAEYHEIMKGVAKDLSQASEATKLMFKNFYLKISDAGLKVYYGCLSSAATKFAIQNLKPNDAEDEKTLMTIKKNSSSYLDYLFDEKEKNNKKKPVEFGLENA